VSRLLLRYIAQVTSVATLLAVGISDTAQGASQQEQGPKGILHVGLWVTDVDEMLAFLGEISDFTKFAESERSTGGKRIFVHDAKGQVIELLTAPDVEDHPDFALHPIGRTAGVAHIAVRVDNTLELRNRLQKMGYAILRQNPENDDEGFLFMGIYGEARNLFLEGPSGVTFELFEIKE
jgi:catechol 2,3-dioxygenase-like lactoylglutathione lyase family enzyme